MALSGGCEYYVIYAAEHLECLMHSKSMINESCYCFIALCVNEI